MIPLVWQFNLVRVSLLSCGEKLKKNCIWRAKKGRMDVPGVEGDQGKFVHLERGDNTQGPQEGVAAQNIINQSISSPL